MSAEMDRTSPHTDPGPSRPPPASVSAPASGVGVMELQGHTPDLPSPRGEPVVAPLLSPDDPIPPGPSQPTAADMDASQTLNKNMEQTGARPCELLLHIEQIHQVLQEHSRLLTLLTGRTLPVCSLLIGSPLVLTRTDSEELPAFPASSAPSDGRRPHAPPAPACLSKNQPLAQPCLRHSHNN
ncbi:resuscitation-promoting factor RpfA-like [Platichthys flesus]|uniref:resuscitation-promoting factor RpfA-like n=1 Tax=Platichthys flesus TaxID=8260 RepID=UPI002DBCED0A|nr:resuscitation-promoting factor RpfA-like [Platichthys flesus]